MAPTPRTAVLDPTAPTPPSASPAAARVVGAVKTYGHGPTAVRALAGVDLDVERGRFLAVMGPSGSGKSTLMHCLAGLDTLTGGQVLIGDTDLGTLDDKALTRLRRDRIGFVFQAFNLIPTLSCIENVELPIRLAGRKVDRAHVDEIISLVGLDHRRDHKPAELSGGQQQRVAVARALATQPELIFADEPTGNLDSRTGNEILTFLRDTVDGLGQTVAMVTHDPVAATHAHDAVILADGRIVDRIARPTVDSVLARLTSVEV
jgi:putative ABC transport system ATP-binding protein